MLNKHGSESVFNHSWVIVITLVAILILVFILVSSIFFSNLRFWLFWIFAVLILDPRDQEEILVLPVNHNCGHVRFTFVFKEFVK